MHVITQNCCNDASCVPACPVNCIHPTPDEPGYHSADMLYIDPEACIDCGACIDVCPVNAIVPDYELPEDLEPYIDINARWFRDSAHRGYSAKPFEQVTPSFTRPAGGPLRVAVVGSGPAGCYAVEELLAQRGLGIEINVFERLPVPGGLVRYGVAPDHHRTKMVEDRFALTLRRPGVALFLNVEIGMDISHAELAAHHHAVIYAIGAPDHTALGIPGEQLPGSHPAAAFVAWYNGHPDYADTSFALSSERAVIVGNGNVAIDIARILTSDVSRLRGTDIAPQALEQLAESRVEEVVLLGRRGPAQAAFSVPELLGLTSAPDVEVCLRPEELHLDSASAEESVGDGQEMHRFKLDLLRQIADSSNGARRRIELRFLASPVEILGSDRVAGVRIARNELVLEQGRVRARTLDVTETLPCGLVLHAVGYRGRPLAGLPFDHRRGVIPNDAGRVVEAELPGAAEHGGVYTVGWAKRGPTGGIGTNRTCARETVTAVLEDYVGGRLSPPAGDPAARLAHLLAGRQVVDLAGWKAIDERERALGRAQSSPRVKICSVDQMLAVAAGEAVPTG